MKYIALSFFCFTLLCSTCEKNKDDPKMRVKNNTKEAIYVSWHTQYPDTGLTYITNPTLNPHINKVSSNSLQESYYKAPSEGIFKTMKSDVLLVFIFDAETLESTPWDTVVANYLILKRYELTLQELNDMNWIVNYP
ncbi:MAG: hypothetical protein ACOCXH_16380 [Cyclobacteriaceae bacterium]